MVQIYVKLIKEAKRTIEQVPPIWRAAVLTDSNSGRGVEEALKER